MSIVSNRYDFVYLFDCQDGNPNGDPDSDNSPRVDPETFQGLVSDVCLKRKIRDYVYQSQLEDDKPKHGYDVFVLAGNTLESRQRQPFDNLKSEITAAGSKTKASDIARARDWMCENFFDIRTFGAVMSAGSTHWHMGFIAPMVSSTRFSPSKQVFPKLICLCCGVPSKICSALTVPPPGVLCLHVTCLSLDIIPPWEKLPRTDCSTWSNRSLGRAS